MPLERTHLVTSETPASERRNGAGPSVHGNPIHTARVRFASSCATGVAEARQIGLLVYRESLKRRECVHSAVVLDHAEKPTGCPMVQSQARAQRTVRKRFPVLLWASAVLPGKAYEDAPCAARSRPLIDGHDSIPPSSPHAEFSGRELCSGGGGCAATIVLASTSAAPLGP